MEAKTFHRFRTLIREQTGITLRPGKEVMLSSRLNRRLRCHGLSTFEEYYGLLKSSADAGTEMREFINCVTTNTTSFFREAHHFEFLAETVVPAACRQSAARGERRLRLWSAASSTGQEPYSIAMTLLDALPQGWQARIDASDIDTAVLETARRGVYPESAVEHLDAEFCRRFFQRGRGSMDGMVRMKHEVTNLVRFHHVNLMDAAWPIQEGLDAIFFRNALIYFEQDVQNRFLRKMVRLLRPGGYLFLGHAENVPWLYDVVKPLAKTVFRKLAADKDDPET